MCRHNYGQVTGRKLQEQGVTFHTMTLVNICGVQDTLDAILTTPTDAWQHLGLTASIAGGIQL